MVADRIFTLSLMSDLAPFVAAVLKDTVVKDQQTEIEELRRLLHERNRLLHERNPYREVKLVALSGEILMEGNFHMRAVRTQNLSQTKHSPFFDFGAPPVRLQLRHLPELELWIDGGRAVAFRQDLTFFYTACFYLDDNYIAQIEGHNRRGDFEVAVWVHLLPKEIQQLLQREESFELLENPTNFDRLETGARVEIPWPRLLEAQFPEKMIEIYKSNVTGTGNFFQRHLTVPYDNQD